LAIYVETLIRAPIDELWAHTQDPKRHELWDLRFTGIDYMPRTDDAQPQRFQYTTRLGGISVSGEGETVGYRELSDGSRASALRFWSWHQLSLIGEGSGYWKYVPTADGVRFLTLYDYRTRFGLLGRIFDRLAFRPLMGWATAWSFDRLRLWIEQGLSPGSTLRMALIHGVARLALAFVFIYHGLVLKLLTLAPDEQAMALNAGIPPGHVPTVLTAAGLVELALAIALLVFWHRRWPVLVCVSFAVVTTVGVAITSPNFLFAAFNPVSLNAGILALSVVDLLTLSSVPSAGRCLRRPMIAK
jgi:uncharacterized membrane protein YphA (DoxX/SURF4 family)